MFHEAIPAGTGKKYWNRVKVRDGQGKGQWLTVPVRKHSEDMPLKEVQINHGESWASNHINRLSNYYSKAPYFKEFFPAITRLIKEAGNFHELAKYNMWASMELAHMVDIDSEWKRDGLLDLTSTDKQGRVTEIIKVVEGTEYLSGIGAREWQDPKQYKEAGIELFYQDTAQFNEYSIIDTLLNEGREGVKQRLSSAKVNGYESPKL